MALHLIKLCVGVERVEQLRDWQAQRTLARRASGEDDHPFHVTRMRPRRSREVLDGGSLYWVIKRVVQVRQRILALDEVIGEDGIKRCKLVLDYPLVETQPVPRRAFQGWRYLESKDAPADLSRSGDGADLPPQLRAHLREIGVW